MTSNLGRVDRLIRALAGLVLVLAPLGNVPPIWTSDTAVYITIAVGCILVATAAFSFCPVYRIFGLSTCKA
ncbi:DUF2892 domain-containing protein [uncultured Tateyamaria sp.]|uniref:YgaP family membrane protein n=1 Tax=uncultured Tateyamaria sp. TaxID=455651 RepID=UPI002608B2E5|nr:DUF2892 domain-containing protein [uncultured Tateyamaria sp.]